MRKFVIHIIMDKTVTTMAKTTKEKRSAVMRLIRSKNSKLELNFYNALSSRGMSHLVRNASSVIGQPDFIDPKKKIAIFLDSCFWHGCSAHLRMPITNRDYWVDKIKRNRARDRKVSRMLGHQGWGVFRIWEHSIRKPSRQKWWVTYLKNKLLR